MADLPDETLHAFKELHSESEAKGSIFSQFVNRIKQSFQGNRREQEGALTGRVLQFNQTVVVILKKLCDIKEEMRKSVDTVLFSHVESLMDPLTRDAINIQKMLSQQSSLVQQAKVYKKYHTWMTKAALWMELEEKLNDHQAIIDAVIYHIFHESNNLIDQDLQVIQDYAMNTLETLPLNEEEGLALKKQIEQELLGPINSLISLKDEPVIDNPDVLFRWKNEVDRRRSQLFDKSLHVIDRLVQEVSPESASEEGHEYLVEVLAQLAFLEEEIPQVTAEFQNGGHQSSEKKRLLEIRMAALEEELHALNLNLRLTPDLCERLQKLLSFLHEVNESS